MMCNDAEERDEEAVLIDRHDERNKEQPEANSIKHDFSKTPRMRLLLDACSLMTRKTIDEVNAMSVKDRNRILELMHGIVDDINMTSDKWDEGHVDPPCWLVIDKSLKRKSRSQDEMVELLSCDRYESHGTTGSDDVGHPDHHPMRSIMLVKSQRNFLREKLHQLDQAICQIPHKNGAWRTTAL